MRQHQSRVRSEGAEHVRCAAIKKVVEAAPQGFAIDRHMTPTLDFGSIIQDGGMAAEHSLDRGRVKLSQNTADRRVGWCFPPLHAERIAQLSKMNINEAVDRPVGVGASDDRQDREQHDLRQSIQLSLCPPRIFDFGQQVHKWTERRHGNRSATVKVARQRVRWRRVVGTTNLRSQGGLRRCVAFQTYPAHATKEESVEQPWLFWQMGSAPYLGGGFGHFYQYAPTKIEYAIDRFAMEVKRQLDVLDKRLADNEYLGGCDYTIADIAVFPWYGGLVKGWSYDAAEFLQVQDYKHVQRWADTILERPAVRRGRMVNRVRGELSSQLHERHDASDFETKTQDKLTTVK